MVESGSPARFFIGWGVLVVAIAISFTETALAGVMDSWGPALGVATRYDDNPHMLTLQQGRNVTVLAPGIGFMSPGRFVTFEGHAGSSYSFEQREPSAVQQTDRVDGHAAYAGTDSSRVAIDYRYVRSPDPRETGAGALAPGTSTQGEGTVRLDFSRAEASLRSTSWTYDRHDLVDGGSRAWSLALLPVVTPAGVLSVGCGGQDLRSAKSSRLASVTPMLGMRRSDTRILSSELGMGVVYVKDATAQATSHRAAWIAGLTADARSSDRELRARVRVQQDVITSGLAEVTRSTGSGEWSARWERLLDMQGGISKDPLTIRRGAVAASDTLAHSTVASIEGSWGRARSFLVPTSCIDIYGASATLARSIRPWLVASASYEYQLYRTWGLPAHAAVRRNRVGFSLTTRKP